MKKVFLIIIFILLFHSYGVCAATNDVYDVILFWGQSNMVGRAGNKPTENGVAGEDKKDTRLESFGVNTFASRSGIDVNIVNKYKRVDYVDIDFGQGNIYQYSSLINNKKGGLVPLDAKYNSSTGNIVLRYGTGITDGEAKYKTGENIYVDYNGKSYLSLESSSGTGLPNMFAKQWYDTTGHKVIIVHAANGGEEIAHFLPEDEVSIYSHATEEVNKHRQIYENIIKKYKATIKYMNDNNFTIGNKFYVVFQGESNIGNTSTSEYETLYMKVHNNLKRELDLKFGVIVETSRTIGGCTHEGVTNIHKAQENLIKNNSDIILGSDYSFRTYIPCESQYTAANGYDTSVPYETAKANGLLGVCYSPVSTTGNLIHFNSAALSQMGLESSNNSLTYLKNNIIVSYESNNGTKVNDKKVVYNKTYGTLGTTTRKKYIFLGWYKESTLKNKVTSSTKVTYLGDHTLYAKYESLANRIKKSYNIDGNAVIGIKDKTYVTSDLGLGSDISVRFTRNSYPKVSGYIGTSDEMIVSQSNKDIGTYTIVIKGDPTGDGVISALDYVALRNHMLKSSLITDNNKFKAADMNGDGVISALDYINIRNIMLGKA